MEEIRWRAKRNIFRKHIFNIFLSNKDGGPYFNGETYTTLIFRKKAE